MPCSDPAGSWSNTLGCYLKRMDPQPATGGQPGQIEYSCSFLMGLPGGFIRFVWLAGPAPVVIPPSPIEVARYVLLAMDLKAPEFEGTLAPRPVEQDPMSMGAVGLPVWMAVQRSLNTTGPVSRSETVGGVTVAATATAETYTWSLGTGTVVCRDPGTPFDPNVNTAADTSSCGFRYLRKSSERSTGLYPVSVTVHWVFRWAGGGQAGAIPLDLTSDTRHVRIGDLQAVVVK